MTDSDERERLAATPGLTRAQRRAILDPSWSVAQGRILIEVLRRQNAAAFEASPAREKTLARAFGQTEIIAEGVTLVGGVEQRFGGALEVPRG